MAEFVLRYMRPADIAQVVSIDKVSFDPPWSARSYAYEVSESSYSHMVVLEYTNGQASGRWRRWFSRLSKPTDSLILGYGGLWHIAEEGHISTIASHPDHRGHGYGEILLAAMIQRAITLQADYLVLEVRVGNVVAQKLYDKYEFQTVGVKAKYYRNNNEDAFDMRLDLRDPALIERLKQRFDEVRARHKFVDEYSHTGSPKKR